MTVIASTVASTVEPAGVTAGRPAVVTVLCKDGPRDLPAVWVGRALAVHRPPGKAGEQRGRWALTHCASGRTVSGVLQTCRDKAVRLARLWDVAFESLQTADMGRTWPERELWGRAVRQLTLRGEVWSPEQAAASESPADPLARLEAATTPAGIHAAVVAAVTGYEMHAEPAAGEQFPAAEMVPADRLKTDMAGVVWMQWGGQWWPIPTLGQVESWAFDSIAETPDGRMVEPDAPDAWTRLLGIV